MSGERRGRGPSQRLRTPGAVSREETRHPAWARPSTAPQLSRKVLAIAGFDPSGGAGLAADLKTITAYRLYGAGVITSVTAQNTQGVQAIYDLPMEFIAQQIESVVSDADYHAVKIGMLGTARAVSIVASLVESLGLKNVVVDPVLRSTTGAQLLEPKGIDVLKKELIPRATVVTPNMEEAGTLAGMQVKDLDAMKAAARRIHGLGARNVVVTGGHLGNRAIDVLHDGERTAVFDSAKIATGNTHGIGCTFSTSIACMLARGIDPFEAVDRAKRFVSRAVNHSSRLGKGTGPLNHLVSPF